ncbi:MAG TPA: hypothetical protein VF533_08020 [Solirubrobacteraceae bacterium]|jgi:hypothetical protein
MKSRRTVAALVVAAAAASTPANAQSTQSSDPEDGTPAAVQYQLPVDNARRDAAPRGRAGGGRGTASAPATAPGSSTPSQIRSDNGYNTSATVPGAATAKASRDGGKDRRDSGSGGGTAKGDGAGTGSGAGQDTAPRTQTTFTPLADTEPGTVRSGLLLLLAALVGGGAGLGARRARRAGQGRTV